MVCMVMKFQSQQEVIEMFTHPREGERFFFDLRIALLS